ncbi:autophagy-related protein 16-1-like isoform X2 [Pelodiscus sinensis]|uniref:autophagy-related protein 16-1-like isoform X2 n=1 Tax=Pelodiscus sinensis TaxID=13735 RepID=UPI003F6BDBC1
MRRPAPAPPGTTSPGAPRHPRDPQAMERAGPGPAWRRHVRQELERRERETRRLRGLVQSHEKLSACRDLEQLLAANLHLEAGTQEFSTSLEIASLRLQHAVELAELRGAQNTLAQHVAHLSDALNRSEAECKEQRARAGRCARELAGLAGHCEELHAQLWERSQEVEGLRTALGAALQARDQLEARWVQEKQLEAQRVNEANVREERSPGAELVTSESRCNTSCEELAAEGLDFRGSSSPGRGEEMPGERPEPVLPPTAGAP